MNTDKVDNLINVILGFTSHVDDDDDARELFRIMLDSLADAAEIDGDELTGAERQAITDGVSMEDGRI